MGTSIGKVVTMVDARLWQYDNKALSELILQRPPEPGKVIPVATCVSCSGCGNFAVVGYSDGVVWRFNMQSAKERGALTGAKGHGAS